MLLNAIKMEPVVILWRSWLLCFGITCNNVLRAGVVKYPFRFSEGPQQRDGDERTEDICWSRAAAGQTITLNDNTEVFHHHQTGSAPTAENEEVLKFATFTIHFMITSEQLLKLISVCHIQRLGETESPTQKFELEPDRHPQRFQYSVLTGWTSLNERSRTIDLIRAWGWLGRRSLYRSVAAALICSHGTDSKFTFHIKINLEKDHKDSTHRSEISCWMALFSHSLCPKSEQTFF